MYRHRFALLLAAALLAALPLCAGDKPAAAPKDQSKTAGQPQAGSPSQPDGAPPEKMLPQTKVLVMRDLMAEHAFARIVLPRGMKGLDLKHGKVTPDEAGVARLVADNGAAARPGDRVVISNVVVRDKDILFEINGGPKKKEKWYRHLQIGMGQAASITPPPTNLESAGTAIDLQFDNYVPELTGTQVRELLAPVLDFKALNQTEAYAKTLPPKVQEAIKNHRVLVGMDKDMVIIAKGRPPKKVRDKDDKGQDYEEWIYGDPPQEVDFVRFSGPFVSQLEIMTVDGQKIVRTEREIDLKSVEEEQVAQKKPDEQPAVHPTLRRPGEEQELPEDRSYPTKAPYPTGTPTDSPSPQPHPFTPAP